MERIVCFSPGEYHLYEQDFDLVVVLDALRATSAICTAMEHGVVKPSPATLEEARAYMNKATSWRQNAGDKSWKGLTWAILHTATWTPS